ncbi:hypothetical protein Pint_35700 [Pistacia integerrima]|uniref:Uncharacterized protein n=1 Tax=Pistacia integerrima TaxID=434235 RepID=A0ACC0XZ47_9ROSI|nr:hypothetical protein Pint_35700 [Pistacia integerrima]
MLRLETRLSIVRNNFNLNVYGAFVTESVIDPTQAHKRRRFVQKNDKNIEQIPTHLLFCLLDQLIRVRVLQQKLKTSALTFFNNRS